jgi:hypothetical protein
MSFFSRILNFFSPNKRDTSVEALKEVIKEVEKESRIRARDEKGRYIGDDPLTEEDEAWIQGKE